MQRLQSSVPIPPQPSVSKIRSVCEECGSNLIQTRSHWVCGNCGIISDEPIFGRELIHQFLLEPKMYSTRKQTAVKHWKLKKLLNYPNYGIRTPRCDSLYSLCNRLCSILDLAQYYRDQSLFLLRKVLKVHVPNTKFEGIITLCVYYATKHSERIIPLKKIAEMAGERMIRVKKNYQRYHHVLHSLSKKKSPIDIVLDRFGKMAGNAKCSYAVLTAIRRDLERYDRKLLQHTVTELGGIFYGLIRSKYQLKLSAKAIGDALGITPTTLYHHANKHGLYFKRRAEP